LTTRLRVRQAAWALVLSHCALRSARLYARVLDNCHHINVNAVSQEGTCRLAATVKGDMRFPAIVDCLHLAGIRSVSQGSHASVHQRDADTVVIHARSIRGHALRPHNHERSICNGVEPRAACPPHLVKASVRGPDNAHMIENDRPLLHDRCAAARAVLEQTHLRA
jgi:hypothetical protein